MPTASRYPSSDGATPQGHPPSGQLHHVGPEQGEQPGDPHRQHGVSHLLVRSESNDLAKVHELGLDQRRVEVWNPLGESHGLEVPGAHAGSNRRSHLGKPCSSVLVEEASEDLAPRQLVEKLVVQKGAVGLLDVDEAMPLGVLDVAILQGAEQHHAARPNL
jgi:hypothetical protein